VCIALCTIVAHNIAQNRPDSFPPYPPDNHHCSDDVYLMEGGILLEHSFTAHMPLLTETSAFGLERRQQSSPQQCFMHCVVPYTLESLISVRVSSTQESFSLTEIISVVKMIVTFVEGESCKQLAGGRHHSV